MCENEKQLKENIVQINWKNKSSAEEVERAFTSEVGIVLSRKTLD